VGDDELEDIRRRRMAELQRAQAQRQADVHMQAAEEQAQREEQEAQKDALLRQILMPDARERLARLKMARPEEARALEAQLIQLAQSGRLQGRIDDEQLKVILARLFPGQRDINIRRK
jgi:programmed cell death protein 5